MFSFMRQRNHSETGTGWRNIIRSAVFFLLLFQAAVGIISGAAEGTYNLVGTIQSKGFTGAVIITPDGKQSFYRLRETLPDGAELVKVDADSISLKGSDGSRYDMFITASANSGGPVLISPNVTPALPREAMPNSAKKLRGRTGRLVAPDNDE